MKKHFLLFVILLSSTTLFAQKHWQQKVDYDMSVSLDVESNLYEGAQTVVYTNNSPDTLKNIYYHLYYNAFQPGSEMAVRIKTAKDKNRRFKHDFETLTEKEIGFLHVSNVTQDGVSLNVNEEETILEVPLAKAIAPGESSTFSLKFNGQVPILIRRAGRQSKEGVAFSMAQWYPKIVEYDYDGWNAEPYLGREFHGVWGDFDVKITIDKDYTVAGSGYLQNPEKIGHGYTDKFKQKPKKGKLTWHFVAPDVHDFTWAADPEYIHDMIKGPNDVDLHFFYKNNPEIIDNWKKLQPLTVELMEYFNTKIGPYPYKQYSVIQGGDGGMEYAMCTLITGERKFGSLVGVTSHELAHSWFQFLLATNEMKHEWMDEGFTSFISTLAKIKVLNEEKEFPLENYYNGYYYIAREGIEQPLATNANRYDYNRAYESGAYSKGSVFLAQLGYVIGMDNLFKTIQLYYDENKFTHPTPNDFRRAAEKVSGIHLKWYLTDWTQTTNKIDYAVKTVTAEEDTKTKITLERIESMPMPIDLLVTYKDGTQEMFYIPVRIMRGEKENPYPSITWNVEKDWAWAYPTYNLVIDKPLSSVDQILIDPSFFMADINKENNLYTNK